MKRTGIGKWLAAAAVALIASAPSAHASAVMTLEPPGGSISGVPGALVGWGFTLTNGANWVSIDSVTIENETSPLGGSAGGFTSYMDLLGGLSNGVTLPNQTWTLPFSPGSPGSGLGQYAIDPSTPFGASDSGDFVIYYDEFSADPNTCGSCYLDTLQLFDANGNPQAFAIDTSLSEVPEPATSELVIAGCFAWLVRRLVRRLTGRPTIPDDPTGKPAWT
ncbi:MAG: hypothetical protein P4L56_20425 [Candidatus Sulfopaludibacter sp.]|nr:hypothetical protein [Candidatus Sulfopaludibacter sp.]